MRSMPTQNTSDTNPRKDPSVASAPRKRGFAAMDPNLVRDLARKGGVAAHRAGTAHEFSAEEARVAGRKGGLATHGARRDGADGADRNPA
jgi:general stress protein YciG